MKTASSSPDLYARVTDRIVAELEAGVRPWLKPWSGGQGGNKAGAAVNRPLRHNGEPYSGINVLLLWGDAIDKGFLSSTWMTYRQAATLGAQVRKGEKGSRVVYADRYLKEETGESGEAVERSIAFLKSYTVFNVEQIDGLPERYRPAPSVQTPDLQPIPAVEAFFAGIGAVFRHGGDQAYYVPSADLIQLPHPGAFRDAESYAATKAHELIHWTGHDKRLARCFGRRFGDDAYAVEELVAELGSAFLCADLGVTPEPRPDHAAYLGHWLDVLKADKRAIFTAAAQAQKAADFLHGGRSLEGREAETSHV